MTEGLEMAVGVPTEEAGKDGVWNEIEGHVGLWVAGWQYMGDGLWTKGNLELTIRPWQVEEMWGLEEKTWRRYVEAIYPILVSIKKTV